MNLGAEALLDSKLPIEPDPYRDSPSFLQSKLEHLALEFYRALAAALSRKEGNETQLAESLLNLVEAFPTEPELTARLHNRISIDRMGAQHLVFDLSTVPRIEEIHLEEL